MRERGGVMTLRIPSRRRDHTCEEKSIRKEIRKHRFGGSITYKIWTYHIFSLVKGLFLVAWRIWSLGHSIGVNSFMAVHRPFCSAKCASSASKIAKTFFSFPSLLHCCPELYTALTATRQRRFWRIFSFCRLVSIVDSVVDNIVFLWWMWWLVRWVMRAFELCKWPRWRFEFEFRHENEDFFLYLIFRIQFFGFECVRIDNRNFLNRK